MDTPLEMDSRDDMTCCVVLVTSHSGIDGTHTNLEKVHLTELRLLFHLIIIHILLIVNALKTFN